MKQALIAALLFSIVEPIQGASGPGLVAIRSSAYPQSVTTLSEHDASALLGFVSELGALEDPMPFPPRLVAGLRSLIAADGVSYSELDPVQRRSILQVWHKAEGEDQLIWGEEEPYDPDEDLFWMLRSTHPLCGDRSVSDDWTIALKVSDFVSLHEFRRTPIYDALYRGEIDHWLEVGLEPEPDRTRNFIFTRFDQPDFDERDRLVASLLQPHLAKRAEEAEAALRATEALAAIEEGTIEEARRVVLCSATGVIEFGSASSRVLLKRFLGLENGRVPTSVLARRELEVRQGDRSLFVRIARTGALRLLMLEERDERIGRLSAREREVLDQVQLGKANDAIALELGIARATVAKHLEHAYRKLGVQNRMSAAALLDS
jgi:DNA-binding CsgD family transcriptional regulator